MKATDPPIVVEQTFNASIETIWKAITEHDQMIQWFFDNIPSFKPEVGFTTQFDVEAGGRNFIHAWKLTEVIPKKKIVYNWKFSNYPGDGYVAFELLEQPDGQNTLRFTNTIVEDFPEGIPELTRESCIAGWEYFIQNSLKAYLEEN